VTVYAVSGGIWNCPLEDGHFAAEVPAEEPLIITLETESLNRGNLSDVKYGGDRPDGPAMAPDDYARQMKEQGAPIKVVQKAKGTYKQIPGKYAAKATSPLSVTVSRGGGDVQTFTLED
jgi:hypothetical protein